MKSMPPTGSPPMPTQRRLAHAERAQLTDRFVGQRAGAGRRTPMLPGLVDVARHDADLARAGGDDAGAVRADEPRRPSALERRGAPGSCPITGMPSVMQMTSLHAGVDGLEDRVRRAERWHEDAATCWRRFASRPRSTVSNTGTLTLAPPGPSAVERPDRRGSASRPATILVP